MSSSFPKHFVNNSETKEFFDVLNGRVLRQMTLGESFQRTKVPKFKFPKPFLISDVVYEVYDSSDSEETDTLSNHNAIVANTNMPSTAITTSNLDSNLLCSTPENEGISNSAFHVKGTGENPHLSPISNCTLIGQDQCTIADSSKTASSCSSEKTLLYGCNSIYESTVLNTTTQCSPEKNVTVEIAQSNELDVLIMNDPTNFEDNCTEHFALNMQNTFPKKNCCKRKLHFNNCGKSPKGHQTEVQTLSLDVTTCNEKNKLDGDANLMPKPKPKRKKRCSKKNNKAENSASYKFDKVHNSNTKSVEQSGNTELPAFTVLNCLKTVPQAESPKLTSSPQFSPSGWLSKSTNKSQKRKFESIDKNTKNNAKKSTQEEQSKCLPLTQSKISTIPQLIKTPQSSSIQISKHITDNVPNTPTKDPEKAKLCKPAHRSKSPVTLTPDSVSKSSLKTTSKSMTTKVTIDATKPSCSKTLKKFPSSQNVCTTAKKRPPLNSRSPRIGNLGSSKGSPIKDQGLKGLKPKDGKQLQLKQLNKLVELYKTVASSRHLQSLLNSDQKDILKRFISMEDQQKYVVMKLFIWKKSWYNVSKFCVKAQICLQDDKEKYNIMEYLRDEGFVHSDYKSSGDMVGLLKELARQQILEIINELRITPNSGTKDQLIMSIFNATRRQTTLTKKTLKDMVFTEIEKKLGFAVMIKEEVYEALYNIYTLATFTNRDFEDIQTYFRQTVHLRVVFPEAPVEDYSVFSSRDIFLAYANALQLRRELDDILANKAKVNKVVGICTVAKVAYVRLVNTETDDTPSHENAPHLKRFSAQHVYSSVLSMCCERIFTKTNGKPNEVRKWLEFLIKRFPHSQKLGKWYHQLVWLHMKHLDNIDYTMGAKLLIEAMETKRLTERGAYELALLGEPLKSSKKNKIDQIYYDKVTQVVPKIIDPTNFPQVQIDSRCIRSGVSGRKRVYIIRNNEEITTKSVEMVALDHYAENGYPKGEHCEGSLVRILLILYFWDITYNPTKHIPGTFISKLQSAPLDMFSSYFYQNRKDCINERLRQIESTWSDQELMHFAADNWQKHSHESSAMGVVMNTLKEVEIIQILVNVIGRKVLAKIFKKLIENLRENSSGMPDLLVWNVHQKTHKFVEVKGEGDRLAPNQILWLDYLQNIGASIEVCFVHSMGSKRKKINVKTKDKTSILHSEERDSNS
ncbi:fanconi-associated nuclease 1-like [Euwallacea similis]|uniref:fanconi-associated nuclease 1-like n=1 Tax=Euwallacea similis TaxID=1736056 RepID=UPI00344E4E74